MTTAFLGEDMIEMLGVGSILFIWDMYSDASLCSQTHNWYPDQCICKAVGWELKISRLVINTEQRDWTPSGDDERDSKNLGFHTHALSTAQREITLTARALGLEESWHEDPTTWYVSSQSCFRRFDPINQEEAWVGESPSGGVGRISVLDSRNLFFFF